jgi:DNA invertase Pin-like site-specific DNA recombinase
MALIWARSTKIRPYLGALDPLSRPGMTAALEALEKGGIDRLVVYKLDRFARDLYFTLWIEKEV